MTLGEYSRRIQTSGEVVLAPEYKVMQALRFTLDVRQPYRGLKGVLMEMVELAEGIVGEVQGGDWRGAEELKKGMRELGMPQQGALTAWKSPKNASAGSKELHDRINAAYAAARAVLDRPALLTDAYFLYTPSQLTLAALHLADEPLVSFYLSTKLPTASTTRPQILATIHACADVLSSFDTGQILSKDERAALEEKLEGCRDPATRDLVKAHMAAKLGDDDEEEKKAKKREAREKAAKEGDDLFGPSLGKA